MKTTSVAVLAAVAGMLQFVAAASGQERAAPGIEALDWLAGDWRSVRGGRVIDEQWMAPAGGAMFGMSRTVSKGKLADHEFMHIRVGPGGELFFVALPAGQKEATFRLVDWSDGAFVFENKEHDFPQRVIYRRNPDGTMLAAIEGEKDGQQRRIEFPFVRAAAAE